MTAISKFEVDYIANLVKMQLTTDPTDGHNKTNKLEWAELNQAEAVRLHVYAKLRFQV